MNIKNLLEEIAYQAERSFSTPLGLTSGVDEAELRLVSSIQNVNMPKHLVELYKKSRGVAIEKVGSEPNLLGMIVPGFWMIDFYSSLNIVKEYEARGAFANLKNDLRSSYSMFIPFLTSVGIYSQRRFWIPSMNGEDSSVFITEYAEESRYIFSGVESMLSTFLGWYEVGAFDVNEYGKIHPDVMPNVYAEHNPELPMPEDFEFMRTNYLFNSRWK